MTLSVLPPEFHVQPHLVLMPLARRSNVNSHRDEMNNNKFTACVQTLDLYCGAAEQHVFLLFFTRKLHPDGGTPTSPATWSHWTRRRKTGRGPVLSFAVATHHLLAEIRASRQNIKEADIYWGSTCVFSVDLITEFCHFSLPPISFRCQPRHCRRSYLWRWREREREEARAGGTKGRMIGSGFYSLMLS